MSNLGSDDYPCGDGPRKVRGVIAWAIIIGCLILAVFAAMS